MAAALAALASAICIWRAAALPADYPDHGMVVNGLGLAAAGLGAVAAVLGALAAVGLRGAWRAGAASAAVLGLVLAWVAWRRVFG